MPATLPIPSKGAIRTLRHLAWGTSCTVGASVALLTEDRRRRIKAARQIHDNAKRLKASKQYHSAGAAVMEMFEERLLRNRDGDFWEGPGNMEPAGNLQPHDLRISNADASPQSPTSAMPFNFAQEHGFDVRAIARKPVHHAQLDLRLKDSSPDIEEVSKATKRNWQRELAHDITRLLESGAEPGPVDVAVSRFFDAFEEGLPVDTSGIIDQLIDVAARLSNSCRTLLRFEDSEKILDVIVGYGPIDENQFHMFDPLSIIDRLSNGPLDTGSGHPKMNEKNLRKAVALYLTKFRKKPAIMSPRMKSLGERLCAVTCRYKMYDLTIDLYWRLGAGCGEVPVRAVTHLITATHAREEHKKVFGYFRRFYTQASPNQQQFYDVVNIVMDSLAKLQSSEKAEEALIIATKLAQDGGLVTSITWLLKAVVHEWRRTRDISRTRALFDRLEPLVHVTKRPLAFYTNIMHICVEAGDEAAALFYYDRIKDSNVPQTAELRIRGHFALAKAMRKDWDGVKEDLHSMKVLAPGKDQYSAIFTRVLRLFANAHTVSETEAFVRAFYGIELTPYISNVMIDVYSRAGEMDSLSHWVQYAASVGFAIDVTSFNTILKNCCEVWKFSFEEVYQLYEKFRKMDARCSCFINDDTFSILRRCAIAASGKEVAQAIRKLNHLNRGIPVTRSFDSRSCQEAMTVAMAKGKPISALKIYKRALDEQTPLQPEVLVAAVKATLQLQAPHVEGAVGLIQEAQLGGQDVSSALASLLICRISDEREFDSTDPDGFQAMTYHAISELEERGIDVPIGVITHATHILVKNRYYREAIALWTSMSSRRGVSSASIDLVTLTVLLQAYTRLQDCNGVNWVVGMLEANHLIPDKRVKQHLKNARASTAKLLETDIYNDYARKFLTSIGEALQRISNMRAIAIKEKEYVKVNAIKIMEVVIESQNNRDSTLQAMPSKTSETSMGDIKWRRIELSVGHKEELAAAWTERHGDRDTSFDLPMQPLVGVTAG